MRGRTLSSPVSFDGIGVHSGRPCRATVRPGRSGLRFVVAGTVVPATVEHVLSTSMSTTLGLGGARVTMVEHVLSALWGMGITEATIYVEGGEVPILDGSARPWVEAFATEPGRTLPGQSTRAVEVRDGSRSATYVPGPTRRLIVELSPKGGLDALGPRRLEFDLDGDYGAEIGWARTFVHGADVDRLRGAGYGAGATVENTMVIPPTGDVDTRGPSEPARHKMLDAIGDLALLGVPLLGTVTLIDSGHALHVALLRRLREELRLA